MTYFILMTGCILFGIFLGWLGFWIFKIADEDLDEDYEGNTWDDGYTGRGKK